MATKIWYHKIKRCYERYYEDECDKKWFIDLLYFGVQRVIKNRESRSVKWARQLFMVYDLQRNN